MATITKRAEGKYLIRISRGTGKNRKLIALTFRGTLKKAKEFARERETAIDSGQSIDAATLTFAQFFHRWRLAIEPTVSPRTLHGYESYIERYVLEPLGSLSLAEIRTFHIQSIYAGLKVGPTTVRNLHAALRAAFGYAVKKELLRSNPCKNVDLPRKTRKPIIVLDLEEAAAFGLACREMPHGIIFEFALETGMRPEEYLALRWSDVAGSEVSVEQALQFHTKGGGFYFKELKTARSRRRIPISDGLRLRLISHRRKQNEHRLASRRTWFDHDLVFPNEIGRPFLLRNLSQRYLRPILECCGIVKRLSLYSLRHSCATLLLMLGENPKVVADRLGHSSVVLTLDTYSHVLPHIQAAATDKLSRILGS